MCAALPPQEDWAESGPVYRALCVILTAGQCFVCWAGGFVYMCMRGTLQTGTAHPQLALSSHCAHACAYACAPAPASAHAVQESK